VPVCLPEHFVNKRKKEQEFTSPFSFWGFSNLAAKSTPAFLNHVMMTPSLTRMLLCDWLAGGCTFGLANPSWREISSSFVDDQLFTPLPPK
jgi:hypothetical protein